MSEPPINENQIEELKKKLGIDEKIAAKHKISVHTVEKDFDPRLVKIIQRYWSQKLANQEGQDG